MFLIWIAGAAAILLVAVFQRDALSFQRPGAVPNAGVVVPSLSRMAENGRTLFDANCASCHGTNASGSDKGPPLIHRIYHPGHHNDLSFYRASMQGTRAHHWQFGDMPPVPAVSGEDIAAIVSYVREIQVANGIGE